VALGVHVHTDPLDFLRRGGGWLKRAPAEHNLILSIAEAAAVADPPPDPPHFFATVERAGELVGCAFRTPPHKVGVTRMPADAGPLLAEALRARYARIPAVLGPPETAEAVGRAWSDLTGESWRWGLRHGIYRLDEVVPPNGVAGSLRRARADEVGLAVDWADGFARDAGEEFRTHPDTVARWLRGGNLHLWEDGEPACMAVAQGLTAGGVRIGYVYTPPERRGRGYGSACVAALSQAMLDDGRDFCMLYTDLTNPVSNRIYQRLGYRWVAEVVDVVFPTDDDR
jgi:ribosomal protein S18 acetylase RimI-like enzyme